MLSSMGELCGENCFSIMIVINRRFDYLNIQKWNLCKYVRTFNTSPPSENSRYNYKWVLAKALANQINFKIPEQCYMRANFSWILQCGNYLIYKIVIQKE